MRSSSTWIWHSTILVLLIMIQQNVQANNKDFKEELLDEFGRTIGRKFENMDNQFYDHRKAIKIKLKHIDKRFNHADMVMENMRHELTLLTGLIDTMARTSETHLNIHAFMNLQEKLTSMDENLINIKDLNNIALNNLQNITQENTSELKIMKNETTEWLQAIEEDVISTRNEKKGSLHAIQQELAINHNETGELLKNTWPNNETMQLFLGLEEGTDILNNYCEDIVNKTITLEENINEVKLINNDITNKLTEKVKSDSTGLKDELELLKDPLTNVDTQLDEKISSNNEITLKLDLLRKKSKSSSVNPRDDINPIEIVGNLTQTLIEGIETFVEKKVNSSEMDKSIADLENQLDKLPFEMEGGIRERMLEGLYKSQARIIITRSMLEEFALHLKSQCEGLLEVYNQNDVSADLLRYSVEEFIKLAKEVKKNLENANIMYTETHDELSKVKGLLKKFHFKLELQQQISSDGRKTEIKKLKRKRDWTIGITVVFGVLFPPLNIMVVLGPAISVPIVNKKTSELEALMKDLNTKIDNTQNKATELMYQQKELSDYILKEITLIEKWKIKLSASLSDHQDGLTTLQIKYGLSKIKSNLNDLKDVCIQYLNNKIPKKLQSIIMEIDNNE